MRTLILSFTVRLIMPLFLLFSLFLLFRGHNQPGGGFVGGLLAGIAFFLHSMVFGPTQTAKRYRLNSIRLMALGLAVSLTAVAIPLFFGVPLMTGVWSTITIPLIGKLGTPLLFDIGVYLLVVGMVLTVTFNLTKF